MENTVHFSLGDNFGNVLGQLAQEHLIYNLNPEKALDVFESGCGMPKEYALKCLKGEEYVIRVESDSEINVCDREDFDEYPKLNANEVAKLWADNICEEGEELIFAISRIFRASGDFVYTELNLQNIYDLLYNEDGDDKSDLIRTMKEQIENMMDNEYDEGNAVRKVRFIKFFDTWKVSIKRKLDILNFIKDNELYTDLVDFNHSINLIQNQVVETVAFFERERMERFMSNPEVLPEFILNNIKNRITKENEHCWKCSVTDEADALWISPEGNAYGSSGNISDMLHLEIADWLVEKGIIKYDKDNSDSCSIDAYLEEQGWCKVHGNWVLFDIYAKSKDYSIPSNFLTEKQVKFIADWFKEKKSFMQVGYKHTGLTYIQWKNMDTIMRHNLFRY